MNDDVERQDAHLSRLRSKFEKPVVTPPSLKRRVFQWVGNQSVNFSFAISQDLPTFFVLAWIFFSNQFSDTTTCAASYTQAIPVWVFFFLCIVTVVVFGFFNPVPIYRFTMDARIEREEHDRGTVLVWSHAILRGFMYVSFVLGYRAGVPLSCLSVTIPCPNCWAIAGLMILALAMIGYQIARWVGTHAAQQRVGSSITAAGTGGASSVEVSTTMGPEGSVDGEGPRTFQYLAGDDQYWIRHSVDAARVLLWRRWSELAELVQCAADAVPALALWVHYVVLSTGVFAGAVCAALPTLFYVYFGLLIGAVLVWRVWQLVWLRVCGPKVPVAVWVLRASHALTSPALLYAVGGYAAAGQPGMGCWSPRGVYLALSLLLLMLAVGASVAERTLIVIYVTPVRDASAQTRLADTLLVTAAPAARKMYLRPPTRMYPHPHWGGAILYAPPDRADAASQAADTL